MPPKLTKKGNRNDSITEQPSQPRVVINRVANSLTPNSVAIAIAPINQTQKTVIDNDAIDRPSANPYLPLGFDCPIMGLVTYEECLNHARARGGLPECGHSIPTLQGIIDHSTRVDPELDALFKVNPYTFRVTNLTSPCSREVVLNRLPQISQPQQYEKVGEIYWRWRGELIHTIKQRYGASDAIETEQRLNAPFVVMVDLQGRGLVEVETLITGKLDTLLAFPITCEQATDDDNAGTGIVSRVETLLLDYKTTEYLPNEAKPEHAAQVNLWVVLDRKRARLNSHIPTLLGIAPEGRTPRLCSNLV